MTPRRRRQTPPLTAMMRFLLEEFIDVTDDDEAFASEAAAKALARFRARSARVFLPGPKHGAFSRQQLALRDIPPAEFQQLRRDVGDWLRSLVISSGVRNRVRLQVSLSLVSVPGRQKWTPKPGQRLKWNLHRVSGRRAEAGCAEVHHIWRPPTK